jgi:conjugative transfer signal peptidase TraF
MRAEAEKCAARAKRVRLVAAIFAASALLVGVSTALELRVNWTESMPLGLYQRTGPALVRGAWVAVCLDGEAARIARERHYVIAGSCASGVTEIVKRIAAIPGDRIELGQDGVRVNGDPIPGSELQGRDRQGAPLAHAEEGEFVLADGRYWVMGTHVRRSWDSRYFGPIAREQIVGGARPLWTF